MKFPLLSKIIIFFQSHEKSRKNLNEREFYFFCEIKQINKKVFPHLSSGTCRFMNFPEKIKKIYQKSAVDLQNLNKTNFHKNIA